MLVNNQLVSCPYCGGLTMATIPEKPERGEKVFVFQVENSNPVACQCCGEQFRVWMDWRGRIRLSRH